MQSLPNTTMFSNMPSQWRTRTAKQQAPQRKRRGREATNQDSDDEIANTSYSPNNTFHNVDTSYSCDSDEHGIDSDEDSKNMKSNSTSTDFQRQ